MYNGYRVFPGGKVRPERAADHSPRPSTAVMEEQSYTSTQTLGHTGPLTGSLYFTSYLGGLREKPEVEAKQEFHTDNIYSAPTPQKTLHVSTTQPKELMLSGVTA